MLKQPIAPPRLNREEWSVVRLALREAEQAFRVVPAEPGIAACAVAACVERRDGYRARSRSRPTRGWKRCAGSSSPPAAPGRSPTSSCPICFPKAINSAEVEAIRAAAA